MHLRINGKAVKNWSVGTSTKIYSYTNPTKLDFDQIQVAFTNDYSDWNGNRNLYVLSVNIDGSVVKSDSSWIWSTGTWDYGTGTCTPRFAQSTALGSNGYFQY